jgi:hypothetical protein
LITGGTACRAHGQRRRESTKEKHRTVTDTSIRFEEIPRLLLGATCFFQEVGEMDS